MLKLKLMLSQIFMIMTEKTDKTVMGKVAIGLGASLIIVCIVALIVWKVVIPKIKDKKEKKDKKDK